MVKVEGQLVDGETRCVHYQSELDIIAIKFKCCNAYFPCFNCHSEFAKHEAQVWPRNEFNTLAVLCGLCKTEISIDHYLNSDNHCPNCNSPFNPRCKLHHPLYFEV
jgi:uncharacterized CHY-type Zn-finger protein